MAFAFQTLSKAERFFIQSLQWQNILLNIERNNAKNSGYGNGYHFLNR